MAPGLRRDQPSAAAPKPSRAKLPGSGTLLSTTVVVATVRRQRIGRRRRDVHALRAGKSGVIAQGSSRGVRQQTNTQACAALADDAFLALREQLAITAPLVQMV